MVANVLIVNDTDKKLSPLAVTLKQQFYSICCVKTFEHAFKFVRKNNIDVILIVVNDEEETARMFPFFREACRATPIICIVKNINNFPRLEADCVITLECSNDIIIKKINQLSRIKNQFETDTFTSFLFPANCEKKVTFLLYDNCDFLDFSIITNARIVKTNTITPDIMDSDIFLINANNAHARKYAATIRLKSHKVPIVFTYHKNSGPQFFSSLWAVDCTDIFDEKIHKTMLSYEINSLIKFQKMYSLCLNKIRSQSYSSTVDVVTGVYNRSYLEEFIKQHDADAVSDVIFMIDVDKFKLINDKLGHSTADFALNRIAKIIKKCIRSSDIVARYGGDEFIIIMTDITQEIAMDIAHRIQNRVANFFIQDTAFSVSIGIYNRDRYTPIKAAISIADELMYTVKKSGGNDISMM